MKKSYFIKINNLVHLLITLLLLTIVLSLLLKGTFDVWRKIYEASVALTKILSFTLYYSGDVTISNITSSNFFIFLILKELSKSKFEILLSGLKIIFSRKYQNRSFPKHHKIFFKNEIDRKKQSESTICLRLNCFAVKAILYLSLNEIQLLIIIF
ncbi:hypothetical protein LYY07_000611 [Listeria monocytogenes]|nr:hypothetical protein [Listeria monocytogenes]